jgi:hypothetical protein
MFLTVRRVGATFLGLAALFGSFNGPAQAQRTPIVGAINPGIAPARGLAGFATASALANRGTGFGALGFGAAGFRPGLGLGGLGFNGLGFGTLNPSFAGGLGGYGSLLNGGLGGAGLYGGYGLAGGYGIYGTQWMMNPYEGYLSGASSLTNANAQYQVTISQAKLLRQEAIRSAFQTRRAAIEQAKGVLMVVYRVSADQAFRVLQWRSQQTNTKLRALAKQLVNEVINLPPPSTAVQSQFDHVLLTVHERVPAEPGR